MLKKFTALFLALAVLVGAAPVWAADSYSFTLTIPYEDADADGVNDYTPEVGTLTKYYVYSYLEPSASQTEEETAVYTYAVPAGTYFYRVSNLQLDDAVTYGDYIRIKDDASAAVTKEQMYVGAAYDKQTVMGDCAVNRYDVADLYLNINPAGHLNLQTGETYTLYPLRNWLPIEGISNAKVIEPDFHYEILPVSGGSVVEIEQDQSMTSARHSARLTATGAGTAIVLVTYDAMTNAQGMKTSGSADPTFFSAIWPENTGVFVVTVDQAVGSVSSMTVNAGKNQTATKLSGDLIDAEHDVLYYTGTEGASYTFTPERGTAVTVLRPSYTAAGAMTFAGGFSGDGVTVQEDGSVTVSGLTQGSSIVRLERDGAVAYQVLRAKELDYTVSYSDENGETAAAMAKPGDTVTIVFDTLYHPGNKLSGYYNNSACISYTGQDGSAIKSSANQYLFAVTPAAQTISFTIPADWQGRTYQLTEGSLLTGGWGSTFGAHRSVTYEAGKDLDFAAVANVSNLCVLPDIAIPVSTGYDDGDGLKSVTVSAYDYTAVTAGLEGATETGVVLDRYTVRVGQDATAAEAVAQAFEENQIAVTGLENGYISSINGLGESQGFAGWCMAYNGDYDNSGINYITLADGDAIRFDYSCNFDGATDDIGNGWYGLPILQELTLGGSTVKMGSETTYDANYNAVTSYYIYGNQNIKVAMQGAGTESDPFVIPVTVADGTDLTALTAGYQTALHEQYRQVEGLDGERDYSNALRCSLAAGLWLKTYYKVQVTAESPEEGSGSGGSGSSGGSSNSIAVSFRLIGATASTDDVDLSLGSAGYYGSEYVTWMQTKSYRLGKDATVYDLLRSALVSVGLEAEGLEDDYISGIEAPSVLGGEMLMELSNGQYAGWMFAINGKHKSTSIRQQALKDGDSVVLHYVNDYRYEISDWFGDASYPSLGDGTYYDAWLKAADKNPSDNSDGTGGGSTGNSGGTTATTPGTGAAMVTVPASSTETNNASSVKHHAFTDVEQASWYGEAVQFVYEKGLFNGITETSFEPDTAMNRGMLVTVLYRMEEKPAVSGESKFTDVPAGIWYADAVQWAYENGIATGYDDGTFGADDPISREQLAAFLYRYAAYKKLAEDVAGGLEAYKDAASVSPYAVEAVTWSNGVGLIRGVTEEELQPHAAATRAQVAVILMRYMEQIVK